VTNTYVDHSSDQPGSEAVGTLVARITAVRCHSGTDRKLNVTSRVGCPNETGPRAEPVDRVCSPRDGLAGVSFAEPTGGTMADVQRSDEPRGSPGWLPDEVVNAGRENLDAAHVERYDRKMDARVLDEMELLRTAGLGPSAIVVDLGSGTGQFALAVASSCRRVVAVDPSPVMLERLRHKVHDAAIDNVEVVAGGFLTYEHVGDPADIVYSRYALHHLSDFWKVMALHRVRSVLRPGGVFRLWDIVYNFDADEAHERIETWCAPFGDEVEGGWARWEMEEHVRDEHSTFTWLLEAMCQRTQFTIESAEYSVDGFDARYLLRATSRSRP
jgi:ubiquinone/menaquinone biosynthesis C-methylase UbiE